MPGIFEALPGIDVPVSSISSGLDQMWEGNAASGKPAPEGENAKAIQVNFVLHLGLLTDAADAVRQFQTAVLFSRKYPCRVVVLCPMAEDNGVCEIRAKVYGECSIGKTPDDMRCCEFVLLSYPRCARIYLESQVSICLSSDLPLYYWAHRFSDPARLADYRYLLTTARRVLIDSASAPADSLDFPWPRPENVRDLALARLLPVRQSIGQFLGRYPVEALSRDLVSIRVAHGAEVGAEAHALLRWVRGRLDACGAAGESSGASLFGSMPPRAMALVFDYRAGKSFSWKADVDTAHAVFEADFGAGKTVLPATVSLLTPEGALSEAMFF